MRNEQFYGEVVRKEARRTADAPPAPMNQTSGGPLEPSGPVHICPATGATMPLGMQDVCPDCGASMNAADPWPDKGDNVEPKGPHSEGIIQGVNPVSDTGPFTGPRDPSINTVTPYQNSGIGVNPNSDVGQYQRRGAQSWEQHIRGQEDVADALENADLRIHLQEHGVDPEMPGDPSAMHDSAHKDYMHPDHTHRSEDERWTVGEHNYQEGMDRFERDQRRLNQQESEAWRESKVSSEPEHPDRPLGVITNDYEADVDESIKPWWAFEEPKTSASEYDVMRGQAGPDRVIVRWHHQDSPGTMTSHFADEQEFLDQMKDHYRGPVDWYEINGQRKQPKEAALEGLNLGEATPTGFPDSAYDLQYRKAQGGNCPQCGGVIGQNGVCSSCGHSGGGPQSQPGGNQPSMSGSNPSANPISAMGSIEDFMERVEDPVEMASRRVSSDGFLCASCRGASLLGGGCESCGNRGIVTLAEATWAVDQPPPADPYPNPPSPGLSDPLAGNDNGPCAECGDPADAHTVVSTFGHSPTVCSVCHACSDYRAGTGGPVGEKGAGAVIGGGVPGEAMSPFQAISPTSPIGGGTYGSLPAVRGPGRPKPTHTHVNGIMDRDRNGRRMSPDEIHQHLIQSGEGHGMPADILVSSPTLTYNPEHVHYIEHYGEPYDKKSMRDPYTEWRKHMAWWDKERLYEPFILATLHTAPGGGVHGPYYIREMDGKFFVVNSKGEKKNSKGYDSKAEARDLQKALYVNVPKAREQAEKAAKTAQDDGDGDDGYGLDYDLPGDDDFETNPPSCPTCNGPGNYMGQLGRRHHFRCRNCGMDFSQHEGDYHEGSYRRTVIASLCNDQWGDWTGLPEFTAGHEVEVDHIPNCDLNPAHGPAKYDASLTNHPQARGSWANVCEMCFQQYGPGQTGTGFAQRLLPRKKSTDEHMPVTEGLDELHRLGPGARDPIDSWKWDPCKGCGKKVIGPVTRAMGGGDYCTDCIRKGRTMKGKVACNCGHSCDRCVGHASGDHEQGVRIGREGFQTTFDALHNTNQDEPGIGAYGPGGKWVNYGGANVGRPIITSKVACPFCGGPSSASCGTCGSPRLAAKQATEGFEPAQSLSEFVENFAEAALEAGADEDMLNQVRASVLTEAYLWHEKTVEAV